MSGKRHAFSTRLPKSLIRDLKVFSARTGTPVQEVVEVALRNHMTKPLNHRDRGSSVPSPEFKSHRR